MDIYSIILKSYHENDSAPLEVIEACLQILDGDLWDLTAEEKSKLINWVNNIQKRVKSATEKQQKGTTSVN